MHNLLLASVGFEDHVGVLDFHFKRSENGALQMEHSYQFRSTQFELGDAMVSRVFANGRLTATRQEGAALGKKTWNWTETFVATCQCPIAGMDFEHCCWMKGLVLLFASLGFSDVCFWQLKRM